MILDGFPRTVAQADGLAAMMQDRGLSLDHVIEIEVDEAALFARIETRAAETGGTRSDDNAETLKKRLAVYHEIPRRCFPITLTRVCCARLTGCQVLMRLAVRLTVFWANNNELRLTV